MKKFYYIYQVRDTNTIEGNQILEEFKEKAFSEHLAVEWISDHLKLPNYKHHKYTVKAIYEKLNG